MIILHTCKLLSAHFHPTSISGDSSPRACRSVSKYDFYVALKKVIPMAVHGWTKYATVDWNAVVAPHGMRVQIRNLRELLWEEDLVDGNTQKHFERWATGKNRNVRFEADTRIAAEMKRGVVPDYNDLDLYDIQTEARNKAKDHPDVAKWIYMGLTESLGIHFNRIDDSSGEFWPLFEECMEDMGKCILRQNLSAKERRQHIEYLASWSTVVFSDFMPYYEKVLTQLCVDAADLAVWRKMLDDTLQSEDIKDRDCYWAASQSRIESARERVMTLIEKSKDRQ